MDSVVIMGIGIGIVLLLVLAWVLLRARVKRWYKIYRADNDIMLVYRGWSERVGSSDKNQKFRRDDNDHLITFPSEAHWILAWEQIPNEEVDIVRQQLREMGKRRISLEEEVDDISERLRKVEAK